MANDSREVKITLDSRTMDLRGVFDKMLELLAHVPMEAIKAVVIEIPYEDPEGTIRSTGVTMGSQLHLAMCVGSLVNKINERAGYQSADFSPLNGPMQGSA